MTEDNATCGAPRTFLAADVQRDGVAIGQFVEAKLGEKVIFLQNETFSAEQEARIRAIFCEEIAKREGQLAELADDQFRVASETMKSWPPLLETFLNPATDQGTTA